MRCFGSPAHAGMDLPPARRDTWTRWLPRARGDGPCALQSQVHVGRAPPRTRGWTRPRLSRGSVRPGSPAHAGMDRRDSAARSLRRGLPRARGDGPAIVTPLPVGAQAPPRTRGWTRRIGAAFVRAAGSPAHAGMDPGRRSGPTACAWLPRARGDGPIAPRPLPRPGWAPPRTRGWTRHRNSRRYACVGSPAHAGMDLHVTRTISVADRLPRARGDGPTVVGDSGSASAAPPRTRGWTARGPCPPPPSTGSPAHAGMDHAASNWSHVSRWLPRARGDGPIWYDLDAGEWQAPPRTRGWTCVF